MREFNRYDGSNLKMKKIEYIMHYITEISSTILHFMKSINIFKMPIFFATISFAREVFHKKSGNFWPDFCPCPWFLPLLGQLFFPKILILKSPIKILDLVPYLGKLVRDTIGLE